MDLREADDVAIGGTHGSPPLTIRVEVFQRYARELGWLLALGAGRLLEDVEAFRARIVRNDSGVDTSRLLTRRPPQGTIRSAGGYFGIRAKCGDVNDLTVDRRTVSVAQLDPNPACLVDVADDLRTRRTHIHVHGRSVGRLSADDVKRQTNRCHGPTSLPMRRKSSGQPPADWYVRR